MKAQPYNSIACVEGYLLRDVFIATCHPNGSWVPDSTSHVCTTPASGMMHNNVIGSLSHFPTETPSMGQNQNTAFVTAIVISTVIVYILSSVDPDLHCSLWLVWSQA